MDDDSIDLVGEHKHDYGHHRTRIYRQGTRMSATFTVKPTLPLVLLVPVAGSPAALRTIDALPADVQTELERHFRDLCVANHTRFMRWCTIAHFPAKRLRDSTCIRAFLCGTNREATAVFKWGGVSRQSVDDTCIKNGSPCAVTMPYQGRHAVCLLPLPEIRRTGKDWKDAEFWIDKGPLRLRVWRAG